MKKASFVLRSALIFCFTAVVASCDKANEVKFDVALSHTFHVNQVAAGDDLVYEVQDVLDAASADPDFNKYKDNIKSVSVTGATYTIQNCTTSGILFTNGTIAYSSVIMTDPDPTIGLSTVGVENVKAAENQEKNLNFSQVALIDMSNLLKTSKQLNVYLKGTLSTTPAQFDVLFTIKAVVTANKN